MLSGQAGRQADKWVLLAPVGKRELPVVAFPWQPSCVRHATSAASAVQCNAVQACMRVFGLLFQPCPPLLGWPSPRTFSSSLAPTALWPHTPQPTPPPLPTSPPPCGRDAEFGELECRLTPAQVAMYDGAVKVWQEVREALVTAAAATAGPKVPDPWKPFWAAQQRFFKLLCVSLKVGGWGGWLGGYGSGFVGWPGGGMPAGQYSGCLAGIWSSGLEGLQLGGLRMAVLGVGPRACAHRPHEQQGPPPSQHSSPAYTPTVQPIFLCAASHGGAGGQGGTGGGLCCSHRPAGGLGVREGERGEGRCASWEGRARGALMGWQGRISSVLSSRV